MIEKINVLKTNSDSTEVKTLCETAIATISSAIYNGVTPDAKIEIERVTLTNLFEELSKIDDNEVKEWVEINKRLFTVKNLGIREAINSLNETKELREVLEAFKDLLDNGVHETRLYEQFISALSPFGYFPTVGNAIKAVTDRVDTYKNDVDLVKIIETMKETRSNYLVPLIEDAVNNYLANKNYQTKHMLNEILMKYTYDSFVRDIVSLVSLDATELQLEYANAECDIEKVYSPVLYIGENEAVFAVNKVYYNKKGNNVSRLPEIDILKLDEEFKSLCEVLSNPNITVDKKGITVYYSNDKAFITDSEVIVNDKVMTNEDFKNAVELSELIGNKEFLMLTEFLRSNFNEIAEIDFVKRVYLKEDINHGADVFKLRDNVFITTHNPEMGKSTFYRNVNPMQAKNIMMEHLRFDVSSVYGGLLPDEEKINSQINETKDSYNSYILELEKKIEEFKTSTFGEEVNEQVVEALREELKEVKDEYKDYLNHIEKYMRAPGLDEEISIDINVDGKKYTVPIPQEKVNGGEEEDEDVGRAAGTTVGDEFIADEPASAVTFDDEDTQLLGDTPAIPDDQIDLGAEDAEVEAEEAEIEAEEEEDDDDAEAEIAAAEEEGEEKEEVATDDDIKVEDEADLDLDDLDIGDKEEEEEEIKKKKREKLESVEGKRLKKSTFVKEAGEGEGEGEGEEEEVEKKKTKKRVFLKKKVIESDQSKKKVKAINEESTWNGGISTPTTFQSPKAQIGTTVMVNKHKGYVIGEIGGDLLVQVQGSADLHNPKDVQVLGAKVETLKPPFKFSKETQKLLFEQYVKCGIYMGSAAVKTNDCYVRYSDWADAENEKQINIIVEGQLTLLPKAQIRIFEDINSFGNLDNYVEGVVIDETTGIATENVSINVIDYTESIGDAEPVRIIRRGEGDSPATDTVPKSMLRTLAV